MTRSLPAALSCSRFVLAPAFCFAAVQGETNWCASIWAAACVTDAIDGWLARRMGTASQRGARLDVLADFVFLFAALAGLAAMGRLPVLMLAVAAALFGQFFFASGPLVYDPLGKYYGAFLFGVVGAVTILNDQAMNSAVVVAFYLYSAALIASRAISRWRKNSL